MRKILPAFLFAIAVFVLALPANADSLPRTLTVSGTGEAKAAPDAARLSAGVTSEGATAAAALAANSRAMNAVFATLKQAGIADKSIRTANFSVQPQYRSEEPGHAGPQKIAGYRVSNTVEVTVDDIAKVGSVVDALTASGANQMNGIDFFIRDTKALEAEAQGQAVADAMAKAEAYAKAAGVTLGPILSIGEGEGGAGPMPMFRMAMPVAMAAPPPIAGGEQSVSANVSITWEIR